jgi:hypothetical protein
MALFVSDTFLYGVPGKGGYVIICRGINLLLSGPSFQGVPDVAAQSDKYRVFMSGVPKFAAGTSASSPAFAGIVALLNDVRLSKKRPPLGFLNPLLYSNGLSGFNDITIGHNSGCGTTGFNVRFSPLHGVQTHRPEFIGYERMGSRYVDDMFRLTSGLTFVQ